MSTCVRFLALVLVAMTALLAADLSFEASPTSGASITVTLRLAQAPPFANWQTLVRFDKTRLQLATQASGTYATFIPDARTLSAINSSGEVRCGGFGFADGSATSGTLGVLTFTTVASGAATLTSAAYSGSEPAGSVLYTTAGAQIIPNLVGLPITVNGSAPTNQPPTIASATATPSPVTGTQTTLAATASDDAGEPALTYTWSAPVVPAGGAVNFPVNGSNAAKASTAVFTRAGDYQLRVVATDAGGLSATRDVAVTVAQTATTVAVTPATINLSLGATQTFSALVRDQFVQAMATQPAITWSLTAGSVGSISTSGLFTASAVGTAQVRATSGSLVGSATANVTATNQPPTIASATATPSPVTGTQATLAATANDDAGEPALTYTWSAPVVPAGGAVTFPVNGSNAAKASTAVFTRAGDYQLRVVVTDAGGLSATSDVAVTVVQTATTVAVTPTSVDLTLGATQIFSALVRDQFTQDMATQPAITWSLTAGSVGSIAPDGVLTAAAIGTAQVVATASAVEGHATATIAAVPVTGGGAHGGGGGGGGGGCGAGGLVGLITGAFVLMTSLRRGRKTAG